MRPALGVKKVSFAYLRAQLSSPSVPAEARLIKRREIIIDRIEHESENFQLRLIVRSCGVACVVLPL